MDGSGTRLRLAPQFNSIIAHIASRCRLQLAKHKAFKIPIVKQSPKIRQMTSRLFFG
jgi:hypothetical protein